MLGLLGFSTPKLLLPPAPDTPAVILWLAPPLGRHIDEKPKPAAAFARPDVAATPESAARSTTPAVREKSKAPSPLPAPNAGQGAAAAPTGGGEVGEGVRAALRGRLGCDLQGLTPLTAEERARCNQHMAQTAKLGPAYIDPVPQEKRAYYDAIQAAAQASRHPEAPYYRDANGNIRSWGHAPAVGCTFKPRFRPGSSLSDKIKATGMIGVPLGPLSCGLALPQGSMTPEIGIPTP